MSCPFKITWYLEFWGLCLPYILVLVTYHWQTSSLNILPSIHPQWQNGKIVLLCLCKLSIHYKLISNKFSVFYLVIYIPYQSWPWRKPAFCSVWWFTETILTNMDRLLHVPFTWVHPMLSKDLLLFPVWASRPYVMVCWDIFWSLPVRAYILLLS